jgi:hypothetical protein
LAKNVADRLLTSAEQLTVSEWLQRRIDSIGFRGKTALDADGDIDDGTPRPAPGPHFPSQGTSARIVLRAVPQGRRPPRRSWARR